MKLWFKFYESEVYATPDQSHYEHISFLLYAQAGDANRINVVSMSVRVQSPLTSGSQAPPPELPCDGPGLKAHIRTRSA